MTTLYVTHDQSEALAMSDTIAVMSGGRIVQAGAPREVYGQPGNRTVANFLGSQPESRTPRQQNVIGIVLLQRWGGTGTLSVRG